MSDYFFLSSSYFLLHLRLSFFIHKIWYFFKNQQMNRNIKLEGKEFSFMPLNFALKSRFKKNLIFFFYFIRRNREEFFILVVSRAMYENVLESALNKKFSSSTSDFLVHCFFLKKLTLYCAMFKLINMFSYRCVNVLSSNITTLLHCVRTIVSLSAME